MQPLGISLATVVFGSAVSCVLFAAAAVSARENERRAAGILLITGTVILVCYLTVGLVVFPARNIVALILVAVPPVVALGVLLPVGKRSIREDDTPRRRIDERDIMFARRRLEPGTDRYEAYYRENPEKRAADEKFRSKPGLMAEQSAYYDPYHFAAAEASFAAVEAFHTVLDREPAARQVQTDPARITAFVRQWARKLGAVSLGITELKDYHLYSHRGRNEPYGEPVVLDHPYAIALTVEMDKSMLDHAPFGPTVMESAQQYLNAGAIAVQIAEFIRNLGYEARAHIDGNYRVVCPLVARDAGLGEIGRMGLLMTPELGPRVRIAVVTTDLHLLVDSRKRDDSVIDFCRRCKKCATTCPGRAIPFDDRKEIDGVKRWQIDQEACFTYWCAAGTDCGRCISVCPYSHPNNPIHNIIRFGVRRSPLFRSIAVKMDDLLYGRNPPSTPVSGWLDMHGR